MSSEIAKEIVNSIEAGNLSDAKDQIDQGGSPYKDLAAAEKEFKDIKQVMQQMAEEGVTIEEIINEINSRV